ncbi:MAG TPA: membrane protein insertion efficiency factor YidD [Bacteroidetes bacterium]|nr:membrane protein insertion efficiency factor YidD [Bacteroidota bacterium]
MASYLVRGYQLFISPLMPPSCRFYPTCSEYGRVALIRHGFFRGFWLTITRILRCNPWNPGGWDPVPSMPGEPEDPPGFYWHRKPKSDDITPTEISAK